MLEKLRRQEAVTACLVFLSFPLAAQTAQREPAVPPSGGTQSFQLGGQVPSGFMITGSTTTAPPGYTYSGMSYTAQGSEVWTTRAAMPTARRNIAAAAVDGKIYVIGGYPQVGGGWLTTNERYDPMTNTWSTMIPMPTARATMGAAAAGGKIYVIGGDNGGDLDINEEYDPVGNFWTSRAPMSVSRNYLAVVSLDGSVYAIGGAGQAGSALQTVERYSPGGNSWATMAPMPTGRRGLSAVAVNGRIYAMGGIDATNTTLFDVVEEYNPGTNTWTTRSPMLFINFVMGAAAVNGKVYLFGGSSSGQPFVEYNQPSDHWTLKSLLPLGANLVATASDDGCGKIYVMGGDLDFTQNEEFDPGCRTLYLHRRN